MDILLKEPRLNVKFNAKSQICFLNAFIRCALYAKMFVFQCKIKLSLLTTDLIKHENNHSILILLYHYNNVDL